MNEKHKKYLWTIGALVFVMVVLTVVFGGDDIPVEGPDITIEGEGVRLPDDQL